MLPTSKFSSNLYIFSWFLLIIAFFSPFNSPFLSLASRILQVLDHVGIYMLIAGSYTPFCLIALHHHTSARVLLSLEWIAAVLGSTFCSKFPTFVDVFI